MNMYLRIFFALILSIMSFNSIGEEVDPIDAAVESAFNEAEKHTGTAFTGDHIGAYVKGQELWDQELNKVYKEIMGLIPTEEQKALRSEQRKWIKSRDIRFKKIWKEQYEEYGSGNMALMETEALKMNFIKERVLVLREKLHAL